MHRSPLIVACLSSMLAGCGTILPVQRLDRPAGTDFNTFVVDIALHIRCELSRSLKANAQNQRRLDLLSKWAVKIALDLKVVDEGTANPRLALFNKPASFIFSAAGAYKADATRDMNVTYFLLVNELLAQDDPGALNEFKDPRPCDRTPERDAIAGDLGINQTITSSLQSYDRLALLSDHIVNGPFDTISHHVTFAVQYGATATPTWKLVRVSADTAGTLLGANRTATDDLVITLGPATLGSRKPNEVLKDIPVGGSALEQSFFLQRLKSQTAMTQ